METIKWIKFKVNKLFRLIIFLSLIFNVNPIFSQGAKMVLQKGLNPMEGFPGFSISPNGEVYAVLTHTDLQIRLASTNWLLKEFKGVYGYSFSSDNKIYIMSSVLMYCDISDLENPVSIEGITGKYGVSIRVSSDAKIISITNTEGSDFKTLIYEIETRKLIAQITDVDTDIDEALFDSNSSFYFYVSVKYNPRINEIKMLDLKNLNRKPKVLGKFENGRLFIDDADECLFYNGSNDVKCYHYNNKNNNGETLIKGKKLLYYSQKNKLLVTRSSVSEKRDTIEIIEFPKLVTRNGLKWMKSVDFYGSCETTDQLYLSVYYNSYGYIIKYDVKNNKLGQIRQYNRRFQTLRINEKNGRLYANGGSMDVYDMKSGVKTDSLFDEYNYNIQANKLFQCRQSLVVENKSIYTPCSNSNLSFSTKNYVDWTDHTYYLNNGAKIYATDTAFIVSNGQDIILPYRSWDGDQFIAKNFQLLPWESDSTFIILQNSEFFICDLKIRSIKKVILPEPVSIVRPFIKGEYALAKGDSCLYAIVLKSGICKRITNSIDLNISSILYNDENKYILYSKKKYIENSIFGPENEYHLIDFNTRDLQHKILPGVKGELREYMDIDGTPTVLKDTTKLEKMMNDIYNIVKIPGENKVAILKLGYSSRIEIWDLNDTVCVFKTSILNDSPVSLQFTSGFLVYRTEKTVTLIELKNQFKVYETKLERCYNVSVSGSLLYCNCRDENNQNLAINLNTMEKIHFYNRDGNIMAINENGYYMLSSQQSRPPLIFNLDKKYYSYEQFDLKYNRPDLVLKSLGCNDEQVQQLFYKAYKKRLQKMGFKEETLSNDFNLPFLEIKNFKSIQGLTDTSLLNIEIEMKDRKYKLDRVNIWINNVPVFGLNGIDLRSGNSSHLIVPVTLQLTKGKNKIEFSVLNQAGAESMKEDLYITYDPKAESKPDLYLVTIGDSKYADSRFDLTYAAKDAEDIKKTFEGNSSYSNVFAYSYTNEKVTRDNILKLKNELKKAKRDDVVIITVAGHGVLDKNLDYYLATYDMDFNNPSGKGIPYEELESLVDGIAPLKKVIFLDACHSGEVDKEEVEQLAVNTTGSGNVKFRAAGAGIQKKNLGLKTTSELMSELFTDLRKGTGATVISSAGGAEYAMESDQWKNGLFTYCLLHGLKDKAADANGDGQIMLSELQNYLRKEVTTLSNGAQQPTSRIENLTMDFRVW